MASQSLSNGFPYCYRPILNIGIDRTWAHHTNFRLHTRDVAAARRGPPAFVTVVSTARAHSRRTTSSRPRKFAESRVQQEQTRKMVHLRPSGSRNSVHTVLNATTNRHAAPVVRMARTRHSSERAHTSVPHEHDPRKAAAAPPAPTWRRWSQKVRVSAKKIASSATLAPTTPATHRAQQLRSTAVALAPQPLPPCLKSLTIRERSRLGDMISAINRLLAVRTARVRSCERQAVG